MTKVCNRDGTVAMLVGCFGQLVFVDYHKWGVLDVPPGPELSRVQAMIVGATNDKFSNYYDAHKTTCVNLK